MSEALIGGQKYVVESVPIGKIIKAFNGLSGDLKGLTALNPDSVDEAVIQLSTQFSSTLEAILKVFVPTLPDGILLDENKGPSIPELVDVFKSISKENRLDTIVNFTKSLGLTQAAQKALQSVKSLNSVQKPTAGSPTN